MGSAEVSVLYLRKEFDFYSALAVEKGVGVNEDFLRRSVDLLGEADV